MDRTIPVVYPWYSRDTVIHPPRFEWLSEKLMSIEAKEASVEK